MPIFYANQEFPFRPSPKFIGESFPTPPQQFTPNDSLTTKLPESFLTATSKLFAQGLADPRGCEYREIEVGTGSCWHGDSGIIRAHGWVIPRTAGTTQDFAVCWNGLVYPVISVGKKADIQADISLTVEEIQRLRRKQRTNVNSLHPYATGNATPEVDSLTHRSLLPIQACLLLQLGATELAQAVWKINWGDIPDNDTENVQSQDPYLVLADQWLWTLFERAICAHIRGDDKLAMLSADLLLSVGEAVEQEAKQRGFSFHKSYQYKNSEPHFFPYLEQALPLLLDQERRAKQPQRQQALTVGLEKYPNQQRRISALIEDLDEVAVLQNSQPGHPALISDPIVQALIAEGEVAIEQLRLCLASDTRLTRSVYFFRDFCQDRFILAVHEAAYVAISAILKTQFLQYSELFQLYSEEGRQQVIAEIDRYLQLNPQQRKLYKKQRHR